MAANSTFIDVSAESSLDLVKSLAAKRLKDIAVLRGDPVPNHGGAFRFILLAVRSVTRWPQLLKIWAVLRSELRPTLKVTLKA